MSLVPKIGLSLLLFAVAPPKNPVSLETLRSSSNEPPFNLAPIEQRVDPESGPSSNNPKSISRGGSLFSKHCAECHLEGAHRDYLPRTSRGGLILKSDYEFKNGRSSMELHRLIRQGLRGTAMRPFGLVITDRDIWHIVNFIQAERITTK